MSKGTQVSPPTEPPTFDGDAAERSARALEYQAHHLQLIEGHLAKISAYLGYGSEANLMTEVQQIRVALGARR